MFAHEQCCSCVIIGRHYSSVQNNKQQPLQKVSLPVRRVPQSWTIADSGSLHECSDRSSPPAAGSGYNGPQAVEVCPTEAVSLSNHGYWRLKTAE